MCYKGKFFRCISDIQHLSSTIRTVIDVLRKQQMDITLLTAKVVHPAKADQ